MIYSSTTKTIREHFHCFYNTCHILQVSYIQTKNKSQKKQKTQTKLGQNDHNRKLETSTEQTAGWAVSSMLPTWIETGRQGAWSPFQNCWVIKSWTHHSDTRWPLWERHRRNVSRTWMIWYDDVTSVPGWHEPSETGMLVVLAQN